SRREHPAQTLMPFGKHAAQLELRSKPRGAVFVVDGASVGQAPTDAAVPMGRRVTGTATLAGHKPCTQKVQVKKRQQKQFAPNEPTRPGATRSDAESSRASSRASPSAAHWPDRSAARDRSPRW